MKAREFSRTERCSKIDIWNCFYGEGANVSGVIGTDITRTRSIIGRFVPRVLCDAGHAQMFEHSGGQYIRLTVEGVEWLEHGVLRYLKNQPNKFAMIENPRGRWRKRFMQSKEDYANNQ